jgi:flagellar protein FliO/FliZ
MAVAWPIGVRGAGARARFPGLWRALLPAALLCAGALLLAPPARVDVGVASGARGSAASPGDASRVGTLLGAALVIAGALAALPALLKRLHPAARADGAIRVLETRALGPRQRLLLVEVGARRLLLGASDAGIQPLAELDAAASFSAVVRDVARGAAPEPAG